MFYVAADNDLEDTEIADLLEILEAPSSPRLCVTALVDRSAARSPRPVPGQGDWSGARWLTLENGEARLREDWGSQNMADPAVLQRFVREATRAFPARRFALFIADHGEGWRGACLDDGAPGELMDPLAMGRALDGLKLELVGLDACLMGTLEVAAALAPHARYLVASEELLPWSGFAYRAPLTHLARRPQADGRQLGEWLVDGFAASLAADDRDPATLALLDLQQLPALQEAVHQLAAALERRSWRDLVRARAGTEQFGLSAEPGEPDAAQFDLFQLATRLGLELPRQLVVKAFHGRAHPQAAGLAIYFPRQDDPEYVFPGWSALVRTYGRGARAERPRLGEVRREGSSLRARMGNPEEVQTAWLVLLQDGWMVGRQPTFPQGPWLKDSFAGRWPQLAQENGAGLPCALTGCQGELATLPAQWRRPGGPWQDLTLSFLRDRGLARFTRSGQPVLVEAGDELRLPQWSAAGSRPGAVLAVTNPSSLRVREGPVAPGRYEVGFLLESYGGQRVVRTLPVEVE